MSHVKTSITGNCPDCRSTNWKTLEALELTQRQRSIAHTTGPARWQNSATTVASRSEAAEKYVRPACPDDYRKMERYRKWCDDSIQAAEARLVEIDGASNEVQRVLPGLFSSEPDAKASPLDASQKTWRD